MLTAKMSPLEALDQFFGFKGFKDRQEDIIKNVLARKNTFVIMPTGGGKSLCYQLPALMMDGCAIVVSPLIALMKNQVDNIRGYSTDDSVAHFLNSSLSRNQIKKVKEDIQSGKTKLLYIAPETLTKEENLEFFNQETISFVAVDEAHCISEWGHDFRPEYRRIREMLDSINPDIPIISLTATATPKVSIDILKNLRIEDSMQFQSSFNRPNLYYQVNPKNSKEETFKSIVQFIKPREGQSGIIYVQSRKSTEEVAAMLQANGINALPYHAGLEPKVRTKTQDSFLNEDSDVICATIAFGMGIDKPDIRYVMHYDIPKSLENYYQETGRAGRDDQPADCVLYYTPSDVYRLEKFLRKKNAAERELGLLLIREMKGFAESSECRRQSILHYFGEKVENVNETCGKMCDNCKHPLEAHTINDEMVAALKTVSLLKENYKVGHYIDFLLGDKDGNDIETYRHHELPEFGNGSEQSKRFWQSVFRYARMRNFADQEVELYGVLKLTEKGREYIENPFDIEIRLNREYAEISATDQSGGGEGGALDNKLLAMLKDLKTQVAREKNLPPYVIFSDVSLNEMATVYPITNEDLVNISGVNKGKAIKFGRKFLDLISRYVDEHDIDRPSDFVMKSVANRSKTKVQIIQCVDRKMPLHDIAEQNGLDMDALFAEIEMIVFGGTKVNLDYHINDEIDEEVREDIFEYFMEAESDSPEEAYAELKEDDITMEEIQLMRIKFMSDLGN